MNILSLPIELIDLVFSHLNPLSEGKKFVLVCKQWKGFYIKYVRRSQTEKISSFVKILAQNINKENTETIEKFNDWSSKFGIPGVRLSTILSVVKRMEEACYYSLLSKISLEDSRKLVALSINKTPVYFDDLLEKINTIKEIEDILNRSNTDIEEKEGLVFIQCKRLAKVCHLQYFERYNMQFTNPIYQNLFNQLKCTDLIQSDQLDQALELAKTLTLGNVNDFYLGIAKVYLAKGRVEDVKKMLNTCNESVKGKIQEELHLIDAEI